MLLPEKVQNFGDILWIKDHLCVCHGEKCQQSWEMRRKTWQKRGESKTLETKTFKPVLNDLFRCRAISKENKQYKLTIETQEKMLESQDFVMTNLRNGIDYLKQQCEQNDGSQGKLKIFNNERKQIISFMMKLSMIYFGINYF